MDRCDGGREQCRKENGAWLAVVCARCPKYHARPSRYVEGLMQLRLLRLGGFPLAADALPLQTWTDLGVLETVIQSRTPRLF